MRYLTDFADQAVVIPLVLAVGIVLAAQGWRRGALIWLATVAATFAATLAAKLAFLSCAPVFGPMNIHSPSGHVAAAAVVSGGLAAILTGRRTSILPAAVLAAIVIGLSRLILHDHTVAEVVAGALIGLTGAAVLSRFAGPPPPGLRIGPPIAAIVIVVAIFHGLHLPAEAAIRRTAFRTAQFIPACRPSGEAAATAQPGAMGQAFISN